MSPLQIAIVPVTDFQQNCTLMWDRDTQKGVVVDPGGDVDIIQGAIEQQGLSIEAIWLTHGQYDHG